MKRAAVRPTVVKSLTASVNANSIDFSLLSVYYSLVKSIFIVPSCIYFDPSISLDYSPVRSVYSHGQRFDQTLSTLNSIRKFSPTSDILLCELSEIPDQQRNVLRERSDYFLYRNKNNAHYFNTSRDHVNKSHGVSFAILKSLFFLKNIQFPSYEVYFQLSGRYRLNSNFKMEDHIHHSFNAKAHDVFESGVFTTLFSFNSSFFSLFFDSMLVTHSYTTNNYPPYAGFSLETNLLPGSPEKINFLDSLGVEGNYGPDGEIHSE